MSAQGVVDAVKDGVNQVAEKLQGTSVEDSANTSEAKPETKAQNLLDEVTGEYVSKSELKKRQKQRQKDIEKAKKESTRQAPPAPKKKNAADDEAQLNPNVSRKSRH
jgi:lysyl-tRNA synthetase class 2